MSISEIAISCLDYLKEKVGNNATKVFLLDFQYIGIKVSCFCQQIKSSESYVQFYTTGLQI